MGIFHNVNTTCPGHPTGPQYGADHVVGSMTFHDLSVILAGAFTAAACLISGFAYMRQAMHFSNPDEQTNILRIIALIPAYAILCFLAVAFPNAATYVQPWTDVYESAALASFFLLLVFYLCPIPSKQDTFFHRLPMKDKKGKETGDGSFKWFRRTWISVLQYPLIALINAIATAITQGAGVYCASSYKPNFAHIWLYIIESISISIAFLAAVRFYTRLRSELPGLKPVGAKLVGIKGIVFIAFSQSILFSILNGTGALKPTGQYSYEDITFGLPNLLLCGEMVLFALLHFYAFSSKPYQTNGGYEGGRMGIKAILAACNPMDIVKGIIRAFGYLTGKNGSGRSEVRYQDVSIEPLRHSEPESYGQSYGGSTNLPPPYTYPGPAQVERSRSPNGDAERAVVRDRSQSPERYDDHYARGGQDGAYTPLAGERF